MLVPVAVGALGAVTFWNSDSWHNLKYPSDPSLLGQCAEEKLNYASYIYLCMAGAGQICLSGQLLEQDMVLDVRRLKHGVHTMSEGACIGCAVLMAFIALVYAPWTIWPHFKLMDRKQYK